MNDDFLYRIRKAPPEPFARELKTRLDRMPSRATRAGQIGIGLLLFSTAFAIVSPAIRERLVAFITREPEIVAVAEPTVEERPVVPEESDDTPDASSGYESAPSQSENLSAPEPNKQPQPTMPAPPLPTRSLSNNTWSNDQSAGAESDAEPDPSASHSDAADTGNTQAGASGTDYIVTGPLLTEYGTPSEAIETRRALFRVIHWHMDSITTMLKSEPPHDARSLAADARSLAHHAHRIQQLSTMIEDAFRKDTSKAGIPSKARDEIWAQRGEFAIHAKSLHDAAQRLERTAYSNSRLLTLREAARTANACVECHDRFRIGGDKDISPLGP